MVNVCTIIGRVGQDVETKFFHDGTPVCNFSVATTEQWKNKDGEKKEATTWHKVVATKRLAEIIGQYVKKGDLIYISGSIRNREYVGKDGNKQYITEIQAREMKMLGGKGQDNRKDGPKQEAPKPKKAEMPPGFDDDSSDIPF